MPAELLCPPQLSVGFSHNCSLTIGDRKVKRRHYSFMRGSGMARTPKSVRSVLDPTAYQLAFQIAQSLERALVADAVKFAAKDAGASGDALVTAKHVLGVLGQSTLEKACLQIGIILDGKTKSPKTRTGVESTSSGRNWPKVSRLLKFCLS
jgi:hypothetical protein